ncbi:MAG: IPT/TIG domain-containing protein [Ignavibacteriota bacterium]
MAWDGNRRVLVYTIGANNIAYEGIRNAASLDVTATGSYSVAGGIQAGDVITLTINTFNYTYTVLSTDTLQTVALALVNIINTSHSGQGDGNVIAAIDPNTNTQVDLTARQIGDLGNNVTYSVVVTPVANEAIAQIVVTALGSSLTGGGNAAQIAPGTIVSVIGTNLASGTFSADTTQPQLPTELGGTQVYFNGIPAPLYLVSPNQINAQVPWELGDQSSISAYVRTAMPNGTVMFTTAVAFTVVPANPGIYSYATLPVPGTTAPPLSGSTPPVGRVYHASSYATAVVSVDGGGYRRRHR